MANTITDFGDWLDGGNVPTTAEEVENLLLAIDHGGTYGAYSATKKTTESLVVKGPGIGPDLALVSAIAINAFRTKITKDREDPESDVHADAMLERSMLKPDD